MISQQEFYEAKLAYEIDAADVAQALAEGGRSLLLIDTRSAEAFGHETIPGALSHPHRLMTMESTADLPRDITLVAFCDGIGCNGSTKGALKLAKLGFKVKELQGGLDWWRRDGYATTRDAGCGKEVCDAC
ncbi:rhodanese-like domain-containing protein [Chromobacterium vaccinii]|uniref:Rhodanese n=1 Tax=Chromobacterium vaccinii TaxID=1108595 RepID=A0A1D9LJX0_9NEIS|nr:rhodanese-like domain-containing protein [Chromobacterium vaccinii]AOZ51527.1 rhodanese [Chromobacterium vaccinii]QND87049.1 Rhodanese-related sulfurtransferase [Chromobacterium vaccinii]QND92286.1 Rhodanese-related sulfurtransferase [Chromobacterium vaccinii]SUX29893.1 molybdopterin biosynthesis protein MoeB [Chromobacterium vaccinii]